MTVSPHRLPIVGADILRGRASECDAPDAALVSAMFAIMRHAEGIGLAAPQIGAGIRLAVIEWESNRFVLINPTLAVMSKARDAVEDIEGCLSLPGRTFRVTRHRAVRIGTTIGGLRMSLTASGWLARIFQHEYDHLNGVLIDTIGVEVESEPSSEPAAPHHPPEPTP